MWSKFQNQEAKVGGRIGLGIVSKVSFPVLRKKYVFGLSHTGTDGPASSLYVVDF